MYFVVVCKTIKSDGRVLDVVSRDLVAYDRQRNKRVHCI